MNYKVGQKVKVVGSKKRGTPSYGCSRCFGQTGTVVKVQQPSSAWTGFVQLDIEGDKATGIWFDEIVPVTERNLPSWF